MQTNLVFHEITSKELIRNAISNLKFQLKQSQIQHNYTLNYSNIILNLDVEKSCQVLFGFPSLFYAAIKYYCESLGDETWKRPAVIVLFDEISKCNETESDILKLFGTLMDVQHSFGQSVFSLDCCFTSLSNKLIADEATKSNRTIQIITIPSLKNPINAFSQSLLDKCSNINVPMILEYLGGHPRSIELMQSWILNSQTINDRDVLRELLPLLSGALSSYARVTKEMVIPCLLRKYHKLSDKISEDQSFDALISSGFYLNSLGNEVCGIPILAPFQLRLFANSAQYASNRDWIYHLKELLYLSEISFNSELSFNGSLNDSFHFHWECMMLELLYQDGKASMSFEDIYPSFIGPREFDRKHEAS